MPISVSEPVRKCLICGAAIGYISAGAAHACEGDALSKMLIDFSEVAAKSMSGTTSATSSITFSIDAPDKRNYRGFYKAEMPDRGADGAPPTDEPRVRSSAYRS